LRRADRIFVLSAVLALAGCGAEFDPPSQIKTLRVLAVQKDQPYAKPGENVQMRMLWHDGSKKAPRPVQVWWFAGCYDPPGDLYQGCFESFAGFDPSAGSLPPGFKLGQGDRFDFDMPDTVITRRPPPSDPRQPPYGLAYVFFALCAGTLGPAPQGSDGPTFPIACYDADQQPLGGDDFVAGYSAVYAFDEYRNENPIMDAKFTVGGLEFAASCVGDACLDTPVQDTFECDKDPCIALCNDDGTQDCPDHHIKPSIDRASAEVDQVSLDAYGEKFEEQMWVNYYVTRGGLKSEIRLLNDATAGWNDDYGTEFRAPKKTGVVSLWAVVHDNRGGVNWVRRDVLIK
jgi:hypothetical protein